MLKKTLQGLNIEVQVSDKNDIEVRGHRGETTMAQFSIQQKNGYDFGFVKNGEQYELVADQQFWQQSVPVEVFLERLTKQYSVNTILKEAENEGFVLNQQKVYDIGEVKITLEKYVPKMAMSYIAIDGPKVIPAEQVPINMAHEAASCAFQSIFDQSMRTLQASTQRHTVAPTRRSTALEIPPAVKGERNLKAADDYLDKVFA